MNRLGVDKRNWVLTALLEGTSISAIVRMTGVAKHTILKLLEDLGFVCAAYHHCCQSFCRVRKILPMTPTMEGRLANYVWMMGNWLD
jgi:hypothetical protein